MWPIRGYHIRWAVTAWIVAIVGFVAYRQYFLTTPRGQIETCVSFLNSADSVELIVTPEPSQNPSGTNRVPTPGSAIDSPDHVEFQRTLLDFVSRARIAASIQNLALPQRAKSSSTFDPHYFLKMIKGARQMKIDFCFSCREIRIGEGEIIGIRPEDSDAIESLLDAELSAPAQ